MPLDVVTAFCLFAFVTSITPGPNNLMLLVSGVNFGFRASVPHVLGISSGFMVMVAAVGLGLAQIFSRYPPIYTAMKWAGAAYLIYLAWRIATTVAPSGENTRAQGRPLDFIGAATFQWVNPKAWFMAVSAFSTYVPGAAGFALIAGVAALFAAINAPCVALWALSGSRMRQLLQVPRYRRAFNIGMALLLLVSLYPMIETS